MSHEGRDPAAVRQAAQQQLQEQRRQVSQAAQRAAEVADGAEGEDPHHEIAALRHALALSLDALELPPPRGDYP